MAYRNSSNIRADRETVYEEIWHDGAYEENTPTTRMRLALLDQAIECMEEEDFDDQEELELAIIERVIEFLSDEADNL